MNNSLTKITYETTPWAPLTWTSRRSRTPVVRGQADIKSQTRSHPLYEDLPGQKLNRCPGRGVPHPFGSDPAQMVVGKDAYMHRSGGNPLPTRVMVRYHRGPPRGPGYQKEGTCLYPGGTLSWAAGAGSTRYPQRRF